MGLNILRGNKPAGLSFFFGGGGGEGRADKLSGSVSKCVLKLFKNEYFAMV